MSKESAFAMATGTPAPVATQTEGAAVVATPEAPAAQTTVDPRIQALLKKEVGLVKERDAFNKQKQDWEQRVKQADELLARGKQFEDTLKTDAVAALRLIGYNETQIFNMMAEAGKEKPVKTPEEAAKEETQRLLKERDDADAKKHATDQQQANERAVTTSITSLINKPENADKYEYCAFQGEMAHDIIRQTLFQFASDEMKANPGMVFDQANSNALLSEAADAVEAWYEETDKLMTEKIKKRKKLTGESTAEATAAVVEAEVKRPEVTLAPPTPAQAMQAARQKTLTNRVAATSPALAGKTSPETQAQKRDRLEQVLRTGDRSLLRA